MKYRDRVEELAELGNVSMNRFLLSEVMSKMVNTCKQCQRDRMRCTLRPLCPDRVFLNILIALGAKKVDLPSFCYQVHKRNFESYLKSGANRKHPHEPRYPLRYFQRFVQFKKDDLEGNFKAFREYLEKVTKTSAHGYRLEDKWFFSVGTGILIVDLKRNLVSLDPDDDIVKREALEPLITFLAIIHDVNFEILKDLQDTWYLKVVMRQFPKEKQEEIVEPRLKQLRETWVFVRINSIDSWVHLLIGLDPVPDLVIRLKHLRETMKNLGEIIKAAPKKKKSPRSTEKPTTPMESIAKTG